MIIKQDVDDIKNFIHELCNHERINSDAFAGIVSAPVLIRSNDPRHIPERNKSGAKPNNGNSRHHLYRDRTTVNSVPASTNLPNNGTGSVRQVSNDPHLTLKARLDNEPAPPFLPSYRPTSSPRTGQHADRPTSAPRTGQAVERPTSARRASHDDEVARRGAHVDAVVCVAEGALTEEGCWHTVRRQHRRKKNNKVTRTLWRGNGSLTGVERIFYLYLGGCTIQTFGINVLSQLTELCNIEAKCEAFQCSFTYFKAFKITV